MANIGTFTLHNNVFTGTVCTLLLNAPITLVPNTKESDNAPDYRLYAGAVEVGAAWRKVSKAERSYLSVTIDDPALPAAIYARLVEGPTGIHDLLWSRSKAE